MCLLGELVESNYMKKTTHLFVEQQKSLTLRTLFCSTNELESFQLIAFSSRVDIVITLSLLLRELYTCIRVLPSIEIGTGVKFEAEL